MFPILRRTVTCFAGVCSLSACMTWQATQNHPVQLIADENPDRLRVETKDGRRVTLLRPVLMNDSLRGAATVLDPRATGSLGPPPMSTIALAEIKEMSVLRVNAGRTALLVVPGVLIVGFLVLLATFDSSVGFDGIQF